MRSCDIWLYTHIYTKHIVADGVSLCAMSFDTTMKMYLKNTEAVAYLYIQSQIEIRESTRIQIISAGKNLYNSWMGQMSFSYRL